MRLSVVARTALDELVGTVIEKVLTVLGIGTEEGLVITSPVTSADSVTSTHTQRQLASREYLQQ